MRGGGVRFFPPPQNFDVDFIHVSCGGPISEWPATLQEFERAYTCTCSLVPRPHTPLSGGVAWVRKRGVWPGYEANVHVVCSLHPSPPSLSPSPPSLSLSPEERGRLAMWVVVDLERRGHGWHCRGPNGRTCNSCTWWAERVTLEVSASPGYQEHIMV